MSKRETLPRTAAPGPGLLIINADDWGLDRLTTDRILECVRRGAVSTTSAMVFMADSERAAVLKGGETVPVGLHLNLTTPFSAPDCPAALRERQRRIARYLDHRLAPVWFHPGLARDFDYVVRAQFDEYQRLYGTAPEHLDGHHHSHLCTNILLGGLLPRGMRVRRNFSFHPGEKGFANRAYRRLVDYLLARRYRVVDYFFSLVPFQPYERVERMFALSRNFAVEIETHPANSDEYNFLMGEEFRRLTTGLPLAAAGAKLAPSASEGGAR